MEIGRNVRALYSNTVMTLGQQSAPRHPEVKEKRDTDGSPIKNQRIRADENVKFLHTIALPISMNMKYF